MTRLFLLVSLTLLISTVVYGQCPAPVVGTITQPSCSVSTGSVVLTGLPSAGIWTLTRSPGGITSTGSGTSTTITGLAPDTYSFTVTDEVGCVSPSSSMVTINANEGPPSSPTQSTDCTSGSGRATVTVSSPLGAGLSYSLDGGNFQGGSTFRNVSDGTHSITVRNSSGCTTTGQSFGVLCGCVNPPSVTLSTLTGTTCGTNQKTITGNSFGGSATSVTISENGAGSVSPTSAGSSPFTFIYTPAAGDVGRNVIITVLTNNPLGSPCSPATVSYVLTVNANPSAPTTGTITQPTCSVTSGSVELGGLPASGTWTITRSPGGNTTTGTGTTRTIAGISPGSYTYTVTNSNGCSSAPSDAVVINSPPPVPTAPSIGTITQPTCIVATGSVVVSGLPISGTWTLTRSPGNVEITGTGSSTTIANLAPGTYTFRVTNASGCVSSASGNAVISPQPVIPTAPVVGAITAPTCSLPTGSVVLSGLPSGNWTLTRSPGAVTLNGTGTSITLTGIPGGVYTYTVSTSAGCVSPSSANVNIPVPPDTPGAPLIGLITQPRFGSPTGSVIVNGLPAAGTWTLTLLPGNVTLTGTGITGTFTGLTPGIYNFTVTNQAGCTSLMSASFEINIVTGPPVVLITNPPPVCAPSMADITAPAITTGSTQNLVYTYWTDLAATHPFTTPGAAPAGTYYIKGTTSDGFFTIKPVVVTVYTDPEANAGPDQVLPYVFDTRMNAELAHDYETGRWLLVKGTGDLQDSTQPKTRVTGLSLGRNKFAWTVTNRVCPEAADTVIINVSELAFPTLITPNNDGINDKLVLKRSVTPNKIDLVIFDRRGAEVYKNSNYDNSWDGVDYNGHPLPEDTYFYILKASDGTSASGYVVIRRLR